MPRKQRPTHARYEITVAGTGRFPLDMLRYDQCVPRTSSDAAEIAANQSAERPYFRIVNLHMYSAAGVGRPEIGRWESFGWYVLTVEELFAYNSDTSIEAIRNLRDALAKRQGEQTARTSPHSTRSKAMATDDTTEFTLEQRDAMSRSFDAGNYANAYESHDLSKAWHTFTREHGVKHMQLTRAAFVLGFFCSYALKEMIGADRREFDLAYNSNAGRYVVTIAKYTEDRTREYNERTE